LSQRQYARPGEAKRNDPFALIEGAGFKMLTRNDVCLGSLADIAAANVDVRYVPLADVAGGRLWSAPFFYGGAKYRADELRQSD
jgi:hypothetical protein